MATEIPTTAEQVESRMLVDVARSAPDSNPYIRTHWLRSLIAAVAVRLYDFYRDLSRTETRLMPDTAYGDALYRWGGIFVGAPNAATGATGNAVATGTAGSSISIGTRMTGAGNVYVSTSAATVTASVLSVTSITRSGTTATVTTAGDHGLSSFVPVTIAGADQADYNVTDAAITVTGTSTFTYEVQNNPATPATGTISAAFTAASVPVQSEGYGASVNLDADTALALESPIVGVDSNLYVDYGAIGGGTDTESETAYQDRYLDKIRNPVAHFNTADITAQAKAVAGVTRVWVEEANDTIGTVSVSSLTRNGNVATAVTATPHGLDSEMTVNITGADQADYNVTGSHVLVENDTTFHYLVTGSPATPATGTIAATTAIGLGQVRVFFMRDNDADPIPTVSEVQIVKDALNTIRPAEMAEDNLIVQAPTANPTNYVLTELSPDTSTMRAAITANLQQFHAEQTEVGTNVDEKAYQAAIKNTVDTVTGETVTSFTLSSPTGDLINGSGEISTFGSATYP